MFFPFSSVFHLECHICPPKYGKYGCFTTCFWKKLPAEVKNFAQEKKNSMLFCMISKSMILPTPSYTPHPERCAASSPILTVRNGVITRGSSPRPSGQPASDRSDVPSDRTRSVCILPQSRARRRTRPRAGRCRPDPPRSDDGSVRE